MYQRPFLIPTLFTLTVGTAFEELIVKNSFEPTVARMDDRKGLAKLPVTKVLKLLEFRLKRI